MADNSQLGFPAWLNHVRTLANIRRQELAELADVSYETIRRIEAGERNPSIDCANRIVTALLTKIPDHLKPTQQQIQDILRDVEVSKNVSTVSSNLDSAADKASKDILEYLRDLRAHDDFQEFLGRDTLLDQYLGPFMSKVIRERIRDALSIPDLSNEE